MRKHSQRSYPSGATKRPRRTRTLCCTSGPSESGSRAPETWPRVDCRPPTRCPAKCWVHAGLFEDRPSAFLGYSSPSLAPCGYERPDGITLLLRHDERALPRNSTGLSALRHPGKQSGRVLRRPADAVRTSLAPGLRRGIQAPPLRLEQFLLVAFLLFRLVGLSHLGTGKMISPCGRHQAPIGMVR